MSLFRGLKVPAPSRNTSGAKALVFMVTLTGPAEDVPFHKTLELRFNLSHPFRKRSGKDRVPG
jgi:hypothetical protein